MEIVVHFSVHPVCVLPTHIHVLSLTTCPGAKAKQPMQSPLGAPNNNIDTE